jgi:response regulator RpfG family c-di-GMP phosphodiesterase
MSKRILFVDDEINLLQAVERRFRKEFEIQTALGPELGLEAVAENGPFAVVVSDLRMPVMNGIEFLARVGKISPNTVRVMLTGQADLPDAIAAVNQGQVFRFLTKPCPPEVLVRTLGAALEQYRLITMEQELLEKTLHGAIGVLTEILSLVNPPAFGRANRITRYVRHMAEKLKLSEVWQFELAAMLSQIGCVTIPTDVLDKFYAAQPLSPQEERMLSSQSMLGYHLLAKIPRLEAVAAMIAGQNTAWHRRTGPEAVANGAHLLKVALDFDELLVRGAEAESAAARMRASKDYNPAYLAALEEVQVEALQSESRLVDLAQLRTGMVIKVDVRGKNGLLLLANGQEVTQSAIARLMSFSRTMGVVEPISVIVPHGVSKSQRGGPDDALLRGNSASGTAGLDRSPATVAVERLSE